MNPTPAAGCDDTALAGLAERLGLALQGAGWRLATAESCTGGWIAKLLTDRAGSSVWFECGWVVYSNAAKRDQLGVSEDTLNRHGAVSGETVAALTAGVLAASRAQAALAVSGVAGPGGGSAAKPVGTVWLAWQLAGNRAVTRLHRFDGDREAVRRQAVAAALGGLLTLL